MTLTLAYLYPRQMSLYGDQGNILCLTVRSRWRGIEMRVEPLDLGQPLDSRAYDLIFVGGGPDAQQKIVAHDLRAVKGEALQEAVRDGVVVLAICGGYQLLARCYKPAEGPEIEGLGVFDAWTIHPGGRVPRCIGNVIIEWQGQTLVGFENHGGRTYLGPRACPLGRVITGQGNNSRDGGEGAISGNAFGTYLHGPLLPKNPRFADYLLGLALGRRYGIDHLSPLDDDWEMQAHQQAIRRAGGHTRAR